MSFFKDIDLMPDDPILSLPIAFKKNTNPLKVNLGVGSYQDAEGVSFVLPSVRAAEQEILKQNLNKEYQSIQGNAQYIQESFKLIFGEHSEVGTSGRASGVQTIGGTNALRIGGELINRLIGKTIYISDPTWPNHVGIFSQSGLDIQTYPYYDYERHILDFDQLFEALKKMQPRSVILLQASCHNPTGLDPSLDQWKELSKVIKKQNILPFFDLAYQGFGNGIEEDAMAVRYFYEQGHEMLVASSFSKNMGLYGERAGFLAAITSDADSKEKVTSHLKQIIRGIYSTPTLHTGRIVSSILTSPQLKITWKDEVASMRQRIKEMRLALIAGLKSSQSKKDFDFLNQQLGIFSFCGLNSNQVEQLKQEFGIFMPSNGRVNVAGLNHRNLDYVISCILKVLGD